MDWSIVFVAFVFLIFLTMLFGFLYAYNKEKIVNMKRKFLNNYLLHYYIFLVLSVIGVTLIAIGIGLILINMIATSVVCLVAGVLVSYCSFSRIRISIPRREPRESDNHIQKALAGQRKLVCKKLMTSVLVSAVCVLVVALSIFGTSYKKVEKLNQRAINMLSEPVDQSNYKTFVSLKMDLKNASIIEKCCFGFEEKMQEREKELDRFLQEYAETLEKQINEWKPITKIYSDEHYKETLAKIYNLELSEDDIFEKAVIPYVSNYGKVAGYRNDLIRLREKYKRNCSNCHGSGKINCSYCGGSGKKLVTWYSEGNWGDTSYSTYSCKQCGGKGHKSCFCNGGSVYVYENS